MSSQIPEQAGCCTPRSLFGWSPPAQVADTPLKRTVDRLLPTTGLSLLVFFGAVIALLVNAPHFARPIELAMDGVASLAAGLWCGLNFWRSRHAHCVITAAGWLGLSLFVFYEALIGRSLIAGDEQLVFLGILALALAFEGAWYLKRGTNAITAS